MILLDTNILIAFYKNDDVVVRVLRGIGHQKLAVSPVTQAELYFGALNKNELNRIKQHLSVLHLLSIDQPVSDTFLHLMETYSLSHKLSIPDALIAATAIVHKTELYTLNLRDFRFISDLRLYQPTVG